MTTIPTVTVENVLVDSHTDPVISIALNLSDWLTIADLLLHDWHLDKAERITDQIPRAYLGIL